MDGQGWEVKSDQNLAPIDEGWWAAVLSDEDRHVNSENDGLNRPKIQKTHSMIDWEYVQSIFDSDGIIELSVTGFNRGGLLVDEDRIQGFIPISHLVSMPIDATEVQKKQILASYEGKRLKVKVIECEPEHDRIVFSERAAQAGEGTRKYLFSTLKTGDLVDGIVTNVTDFGVFVDLGGLEGLIHVSELAWGRVQHPSDILKVDQDVQALVLQVSEENARIALSLKRLSPNPWVTINERYKLGQVINAEITGVTRFGAFARLEEGIEGLIHVSTINTPLSQLDIGKMFLKGANVNVKILHIDSEKRRLGLSLADSLDSLLNEKVE